MLRGARIEAKNSGSWVTAVGPAKSRVANTGGRQEEEGGREHRIRPILLPEVLKNELREE